ncbi:DUF6004 family protein [Streptomyces sp. NPDC056501]|uniref:DUF6004 family protein n=1 Tax=Streptomyces sp. NPDC056501 TaxID=3345841 RepID=UPI003691A12A
MTVVMLDPSMIIQASLEGTQELEVGGKTVQVDLAGNHRRAAGAEILLFGPDKHSEGPGVLAQISRFAVTGHCAELGGRIMLRVSCPRPSKGTRGDAPASSPSPPSPAPDPHNSGGGGPMSDLRRNLNR